MLTLNAFSILHPLRRQLRLVIPLALFFVLWPQVLGSSARAALVSRPTSLRLPFVGETKNLDLSLAPSLESLELTSLSAMAVALPSRRIVGVLEPDIVLPLASLTKLMTAVTVLESELALDSEVTMSAEDNSQLVRSYTDAGDSISYLRVADGAKVKARNLLAACLVGSANNATAALARATKLGLPEFVRRMNERAAVLGMQDTFFVEPTGLDPDNSATAFDVGLLAAYAWQNQLLRQFSGSPEVKFATATGQRHTIRNTNPLFRQRLTYKLLASKTGYLEEAGYNLVTEVRTHRGRRYLIVLMNAPTLDDRSQDLTKVVSWLDKQS